MSKPTNITIDNESFYLADDLCEFDKAYFLGCAKTVRKIVEKKKIPDIAYEYLTKKKTGYEYSTVEYKKAKLALKCKWVEKNIPSMSNGMIKEQFMTEPNKIILSKKEIVDLEGNEMNLTIVGQRDYDKCYFRVKDVAEYFESPKLSDTITRKDKDGYIEEKHYVYFIRNHSQSKTCPNNKILYLTCSGFVRFIKTCQILSDETVFFLINWLGTIVGIESIPKCNILSKRTWNYNIIYCITSDVTNCCKLGKWHGTIRGLLCRYITYYGKKLRYIIGLSTSNQKLYISL